MKSFLLGLAGVLLFVASAQADCMAPWGTPVNEGSSITSYLMNQAAPGSSCIAEVRVCLSGILSGSFQFQSCQEDQGCMGPLGYIPNGGVMTAYLNPIEQNGGHCQFETRLCMSGTLTGSYQYPSCAELP